MLLPDIVQRILTKKVFHFPSFFTINSHTAVRVGVSHDLKNNKTPSKGYKI